MLKLQFSHGEVVGGKKNKENLKYGTNTQIIGSHQKPPPLARS